MPDPRDTLLALMEPEAVAAFPDDQLTPHQVDRIANFSRAISLRRIADELARRMPENLPAGFSCLHDWRYEGTDRHGSHKGEDAYRCTKCHQTEYRP